MMMNETRKPHLPYQPTSLIKRLVTTHHKPFLYYISARQASIATVLATGYWLPNHGVSFFLISPFCHNF